MDIEVEMVLIILGLIIIALSGGVLYYFTPITAFITAHSNFFNGTFRNVFDVIVVLSFPVSLILLIGIIVSIERLKSIRKKEHAIYHPHVEGSAVPVPAAGAKGSPETTNRWKKIVVLVDSQNQNDWKQAIIDADSILDEMLTKMGYHGTDLGSKLRGATEADFKTLEQAGEAHGVRNHIAHDGSAFLLSQHEAKRVINLYKQVFEEFYYI